jgi:hypothetical protein
VKLSEKYLALREEQKFIVTANRVLKKKYWELNEMK